MNSAADYPHSSLKYTPFSTQLCSHLPEKIMGMISFLHEYESPIDPGRLFKALIIDSCNLCPKLLPQSIKSIDIIEGDGGVGSIKQVNFAQG